MAWISHLPQLASTALAATLADVTGLPNASPMPPGPGARDSTRLAMSALAMWRPLLERAPAATPAALAALERTARQLRVAIEQRDWRTVDELWARANAWRAGLEHGEGE
jgi:prephenate dehydrogenase